MVVTLNGPIGQAEVVRKKSTDLSGGKKGENTMKKRIQKYLAGEREGFSLVELIIVIAIMAILIGVVALAVLPNIGRSRESKDLQALDNILASTNVALANKQTKGGCTGKAYQAYTSNNEDEKVIDAVYKELGDVKMTSTNGSKGTIMIKWDKPTNGSAPVVTVYVEDSGKDAVCEYTDSDEAGVSAGGKRLYKVISKASS